MWYALFDFEYEKSRFLEDPSLFSIGLRNACFGTRIFWQWFFYGALQAFIVLNLCFYSTEYVRHDGETVGLWVSGTLTYAAVVIAVNQKVLMATHNVDLIQVCWVFGSILLFFFSVFVESNVMFFKDLVGVFRQMMVDSNTYFMLLLVIGLFYVTEKLIQHADEALSKRDKPSSGKRDHQESDADIEDLLNLKTPIKKMDQVFHGYAFSQENNPNPELSKSVRKSTTRRISTINLDM